MSLLLFDKCSLTISATLLKEITVEEPTSRVKSSRKAISCNPLTFNTPKMSEVIETGSINLSLMYSKC